MQTNENLKFMSDHINNPGYLLGIAAGIIAVAILVKKSPRRKWSRAKLEIARRKLEMVKGKLESHQNRLDMHLQKINSKLAEFETNS